jgi:hypothetical protein
MKQEIITEYNDNIEDELIPELEGENKDETFHQEEKFFSKSNVRVTISEVKSQDKVQNDFI